MTPREKTVVRAIAKALRTNRPDDMDAFATSYAVQTGFPNSTVRQRAARLLEAMTDAE